MGKGHRREPTRTPPSEWSRRVRTVIEETLRREQMSLRDLAAKTGVNAATLSLLQIGRVHNARLDTVEPILRYAGYDLVRVRRPRRSGRDGERPSARAPGEST